MKINFLIFLMLSILSFNGCATTHYIEFTAVASLSQKTDPYGAVVSQKMHMVSILQYKEIPYMGDNAIFNIIIENGEEEPLTIGNENITVIFEGHDKNHTVKNLDVLSAREFMNDVKYESMKRILSTLSGLAYAADSSRTAYALSEGGPTPANFYNVFPGGTSPFVRHGVSKVGGTNVNMKTLQEILPDLIFDQKTIMPHESITAIIPCRTNEIPGRIKGDLKVTVSIDGEEHRFTFTRK